MSFIKNRKDLLTSREKRALGDIVSHSLDGLQPKELIPKTVSLKGDVLQIRNESIRLTNKNVYVIGAGKSAGEMALALEKILGKRIKGGFVNVLDSKIPLKQIKAYKTTHPFPTQTNINATKNLLKLKEEIQEQDIIIFLLSGGASSMFVLPPDEIPSEDFIKAHNALINSGMEIDDINTVRKHISQIKGGKLTEMFAKNNIYTLLLSDVLSGDISKVGSGPTDADKTTFKDAKELLVKHKIKFPKSTLEYIKKGMKETSLETVKKMPENSKIFLLAGPRNMLQNAFGFARKKRLRVEVLDPLTGSADESAKAVAEQLKTKERRPCLFLANAETTIRIPEKSDGKGGRNQHFILALLNELETLQEPWAVASFDSDGQDFMEGTCGAMADHTTLLKLLEFEGGKENITTHLQNHDSNTLLEKVNATIRSQATGINHCDLFIAILGVYRTKSKKNNQQKKEKKPRRRAQKK